PGVAECAQLPGQGEPGQSAADDQDRGPGSAVALAVVRAVVRGSGRIRGRIPCGAVLVRAGTAHARFAGLDCPWTCSMTCSVASASAGSTGTGASPWTAAAKPR